MPASGAPTVPSACEPEVRYLFVYGTLRRAYALLPQPLRMMRPPHVLDTYGKWMGAAVLGGHDLWDVGKYPGILKSECKERKVIGDVFDVSRAEHLWHVLDQYEGIADEFKEPHEYRREIAEVEVDSGEDTEKKVLKAWVYLYNWPVDEKTMTLVSDGDYVKHAAMSM